MFDTLPTICPVALLAGVPCPGCGMTRAALSLARGDLDAAMSFHPLVIPVVALVAIVIGWSLLTRTGLVRPIPERLSNAVLLTTGFALVAVWVVRLSQGTLPPV